MNTFKTNLTCVFPWIYGSQHVHHLRSTQLTSFQGCRSTSLPFEVQVLLSRRERSNAKRSAEGLWDSWQRRNRTITFSRTASDSQAKTILKATWCKHHLKKKKALQIIIQKPTTINIKKPWKNHHEPVTHLALWGGSPFDDPARPAEPRQGEFEDTRGGSFWKSSVFEAQSMLFGQKSKDFFSKSGCPTFEQTPEFCISHLLKKHWAYKLYDLMFDYCDCLFLSQHSQSSRRGRFSTETTGGNRRGRKALRSFQDAGSLLERQGVTFETPLVKRGETFRSS